MGHASKEVRRCECMLDVGVQCIAILNQTSNQLARLLDVGVHYCKDAEHTNPCQTCDRDGLVKLGVAGDQSPRKVFHRTAAGRSGRERVDWDMVDGEGDA